MLVRYDDMACLPRWYNDWLTVPFVLPIHPIVHCQCLPSGQGSGKAGSGKGVDGGMKIGELLGANCADDCCVGDVSHIHLFCYHLLVSHVPCPIRVRSEERRVG